MKKQYVSFLFFTIGVMLFSSSLRAQIVTGIYTDYNGYWHSTKDNINLVKPESDFNLLAFTVKDGATSITYTTDINNAILDVNNVTYTTTTPSGKRIKFRALPVNELPNVPDSQNYYLLGFPQLADGIDNGIDFGQNSNPFSVPLSRQDVAGRLTSGPKGLSLASCVTNIPSEDVNQNPNEIRFQLSSNSIIADAIGDGVPDLLATQVAQPENVVDKVKFVDSNGNTVGNELDINFTDETDFPTVGKWYGDFYNLDKTTQNNAQAKREKTLKFYAKDLSDFGITLSNYGDVEAIIYVFGGGSDPAFIAYNEPSIGVASQFGVTGTPTTNCDGSVNAITVQLQDAFGDVVEQAGFAVTASLATGAGKLLGTTTVNTDANGQALFNNMKFEVGGDHKVNFNSSSLATFVTNTITTGTGVGCNNDNDVVWTGAVDADWRKSGNWSPNIVPNCNYNVRIPNGRTNYPILDINSGAKGLVLESNASIDLNGHLLAVAGAIGKGGSASIGRITGATEGSELYLSGTAQQTIPVDLIGGEDFSKLTLDNPQNVVMNDSVRITKTLQVKQGVFGITNHAFPSVSHAKVVLGCDFDSGGGNAQIAPLTGDAEISGDIVVEQCFPARRAYRLVASPLVTSTSIRENWQEGASGYLDDGPHGYGTHITGVNTVPGNAAPYDDDDGDQGFDYSPSGNPSMFVFDNVARSWSPVENTTQNLNAGFPYRLMIRGDRTIDITDNGTPAEDTRLRTLGEVKKGPVVQGTQNPFSGTGNDQNFFGNPFQAAVNMRKVLTHAESKNVNPNSYTVYDPTVSARGAYVTVDLNDNTNNFAGSGTSMANMYLQPMQAAFFQTAATGGTPELKFRETDKAVDQDRTKVFSTTESRKKIQVSLYDAASHAQGEPALDAVSIKFSPVGENGRDAKDAVKLGNLDENLARQLDGQTYLSLEYRAPGIVDDTLPLFTNQYRHQDYVFNILIEGDLDQAVALRDNYLDETTELEPGGNAVGFTVDQDVEESIAGNRFEIVLSESSMGTENTQKHGVVLYPNPLEGSQLNIRLGGNATGKVNVEVFNMLGQRVHQSLEGPRGNGELRLDGLDLRSGVYMVKLRNAQAGPIGTLRLIKK